MEQGVLIRTRAIILHEGKLLVVKHAPASDYYALPGGKLEEGEAIESCMCREIKEELGVEADLGALRYVNQFTDMNGVQNIDFVFEIKNGADFLDLTHHERTHAFELAEVRWVSPSDDVRILPEALAQDFTRGLLLDGAVKCIPQSLT